MLSIKATQGQVKRQIGGQQQTKTILLPKDVAPLTDRQERKPAFKL